MPGSSGKRAAVVEDGGTPMSLQDVQRRACSAFADLAAEPELQWSCAMMCAVPYYSM